MERKRRYFMRLGRILLALFILLHLTPVKGEEVSFERLIQEAREYRKEGKVYFNFENIDLKLLTYFISELTGKNIVLSGDVKGSVSLAFSEPVSIDEAWEIYTSVLKSRNYVVVDKGAYVEVLPASVSRSVVPPVEFFDSQGEELITYVYKLKNADVRQLTAILNGLKSARGKVFSYQPANIVVITDTASNIANLKRVIKTLDTNQENTVLKIYRLKNAVSHEVAQALSIIFSDFSKKGTPVKVYNLKSQNAILVKMPKKLEREVDKLIKELDMPLENVAYRTLTVIRLKHAKAKDIANVLNRLLSSISFVSASTHKSQQNKKFIPPPTGIPARDKPRVIAEETSNSLVIYANKMEIEALKKIIQDLDKQKRQILITALITEVSQSALKEIGVRWQALGDYGGMAFRGGLTNEGAFSTFGTDGFVIGGISNSAVSVNVNGSTLLFPDLLFVLSLIESGTGFNVISSPKILAMENMKAKINVSQVIPYAQGIKYDVNGNPII
ncbi:MAG: hypothetical protein GXO45_06115, partial [Aquificae bacterium]|nr:hypothetical protein [Aquificota bacterium]